MCSFLCVFGICKFTQNFFRQNNSFIVLGLGLGYRVTMPVKHGRVFLVPCKRLLVQCSVRYCTHVCTIGYPKMHFFPWIIPWPGAKESLSDVGLKNMFVFKFKFCSSPERAIVKNLSLIFGNFITQHFLWIYIIFHILTPPNNPRILKK